MFFDNGSDILLCCCIWHITMLVDLTYYCVVIFHILLCCYISHVTSHIWLFYYISHITMLLHLTCYYVDTSHMLLCCYISHITMLLHLTYLNFQRAVVTLRNIMLFNHFESKRLTNYPTEWTLASHTMDRRIDVSACHVRALLVEQCYTYP